MILREINIQILRQLLEVLNLLPCLRFVYWRLPMKDLHPHRQILVHQRNLGIYHAPRINNLNWRIHLRTRFDDLTIGYPRLIENTIKPEIEQIDILLGLMHQLSSISLKLRLILKLIYLIHLLVIKLK